MGFFYIYSGWDLRDPRVCGLISFTGWKSSQRCPSVLPSESVLSLPTDKQGLRRLEHRLRPQPWPRSRFRLWTVSPSSEPPSAAGFPVPVPTGAPALGGTGWARFSGTTAAGRPPDRQPGQTPRHPRRVGSRGAAGREAAPSLARGVSVRVTTHALAEGRGR